MWRFPFANGWIFPRAFCTQARTHTHKESRSAFNYVAVGCWSNMHVRLLTFTFACSFFSIFHAGSPFNGSASPKKMDPGKKSTSATCTEAMETKRKKCTNEHELKVWKQLYVFITCWNLKAATSVVRVLRTMTTESAKAKRTRRILCKLKILRKMENESRGKKKWWNHRKKCVRFHKVKCQPKKVCAHLTMASCSLTRISRIRLELPATRNPEY